MGGHATRPHTCPPHIGSCGFASPSLPRARLHLAWCHARLTDGWACLLAPHIVSVRIQSEESLSETLPQMPTDKHLGLLCAAAQSAGNSRPSPTHHDQSPPAIKRHQWALKAVAVASWSTGCVQRSPGLPPQHRVLLSTDSRVSPEHHRVWPKN